MEVVAWWRGDVVGVEKAEKWEGNNIINKQLYTGQCVEMGDCNIIS